jgi:hypothetical protein
LETGDKDSALRSAEAVESWKLRDGQPDGDREHESVSGMRKHRNGWRKSAKGVSQ